MGMRPLGKALPHTKDGKKAFIPHEEAARARLRHRAAVIEILKEREYIRVVDLCLLGWDISVARRALADMVEDGVILSESSGNTLRFSLKPESMIKKRWRIQIFPFELMSTPRWY